MKISTLIYCTKEGMRNIIRNIWFSLASVAIISACIFLFCMFFGLIANVQYMVRNAESTVGITVFFNEDMSEDDIQKIGDEIRSRDEVKEVKYVSAEEAWENFKKEYFKGVEDLAEIKKAVSGMKISTLIYCTKEGMRNIIRNIWFSLASVAIISACIFLFCMFFGLIANVQYMVRNAESTVGITVFFNEDMSEDDIQKIGDEIRSRDEVKEVKYVSAEEAWENFKKEYFKGVEDLAEGFADDNPLAGSASYEIYLKDIDMQDDMVAWLGTVQGIRKINYSSDTASGLSSFNKMLGLLSAVIIAILLAVAIFLISNTITTAAAFRREENRIMRLIGATNFMIRAPFVVQGVMIGLVGALIPLAITYFLYRQAVVYMMERFDILSNLIEFIPIQTIFPSMVAVAMALGVGIGFVGSFFTIRRHLKV